MQGIELFPAIARNITRPPYACIIITVAWLPPMQCCKDGAGRNWPFLSKAEAETRQLILRFRLRLHKQGLKKIKNTLNLAFFNQNSLMLIFSFPLQYFTSCMQRIILEVCNLSNSAMVGVSR